MRNSDQLVDLLLIRSICLLLLLTGMPRPSLADTSEFCLDGEFNLGARYQGTEPGVDEFVPTRWCVVTEQDSGRVLFTATGKSNSDMEGDWSVALLPPDLVRIVNRETPPDIEFVGADSAAEAQRVRRIDPRRLVEEHDQAPLQDARVVIENHRLQELRTSADLPLRGRVPVTWRWDWSDEDRPAVAIEVDDALIFRAQGSWQSVSELRAAGLWAPTPGEPPIAVPGDRWPARINMQLIDLASGVYLVRGVRTGFQHLVVDTDAGLIVADAPAGWVEIHQIPPADLVPGLGISGLSERFVDYLHSEFPDRPIRAVVLTHAHDDHAGGARAFAAEHAVVFAPADYTAFLESALNRGSMPRDRFSDANGDLDVIPVANAVTLSDPRNTVRLVSIEAGPHASAALGVHAVDRGIFFVSDLHVPNTGDPQPREDRAGTECWFAGWAVANLPAGTVVVNSHSAQQTTVETLEGYLRSDICRGTVD